MIKFSIIVAVYNIEKYINQCVESIINQTYSNIEIILVNDGSTDNSLHILQEWEKKDERIKIVNKINGGLSSARNEGLKIATGEYIAYIDGDDWISPLMFEKLSDSIIQFCQPEIVTYSYIEYYSNDLQYIKSYNINDDTIYQGNLFFENSSFKVQAWSKIYKKSFLNKMDLMFLNNRLHEDISYTIPLVLCANSVVNISEPLYYYRQNRSGSIMTQIKEKNIDDFINALSFGYIFLHSKQKVTPYYTKWLIFNLYRCLTHRTDYRTLKFYMKKNKIPELIYSLIKEPEKMFYIKLYVIHYYIKTRYILGHIIHWKKYHKFILQ